MNSPVPMPTMSTPPAIESAPTPLPEPPVVPSTAARLRRSIPVPVLLTQRSRAKAIVKPNPAEKPRPVSTAAPAPTQLTALASAAPLVEPTAPAAGRVEVWVESGGDVSTRDQIWKDERNANNHSAPEPMTPLARSNTGGVEPVRSEAPHHGTKVSRPLRVRWLPLEGLVSTCGALYGTVAHVPDTATRDSAEVGHATLDRAVSTYVTEWPALGAVSDQTVPSGAAPTTAHEPGRTIVWPHGGGPTPQASPQLTTPAVPRSSRSCRTCQSDIAHLPNRHTYCRTCFRREGRRRDRTRSPGRRSEGRLPAQLGHARRTDPGRGRSVAAAAGHTSSGHRCHPLGGGRKRGDQQPKPSIKALPSSGQARANRRLRTQTGKVKPVWGRALECPISNCGFSGRGVGATAAIDVHTRSQHVVLDCPLASCQFSVLGDDRCDRIATHARSHGENRVRFTKTDIQPRPTSNPGKSYLCPWISTFYGLLKSPPFARAVVAASSAMSETLCCLKDCGLFRDPVTNLIGGKVADFIYHPMARPLATHMLRVLGSNDDDVVCSGALFHLIGAYLPERQGVQDHFAVIYTDIQRLCPSVLPFVGAAFTRHKICKAHEHTTAMKPVIEDYIFAAKNGSHLLDSLCPNAAPGPNCGQDGCESVAVLHQELSADQPSTLLVAIDLMLYDQSGTVADSNAKNTLPMHLDDETVAGPNGTEYAVAAVMGHCGQEQDKGHWIVQDANALANDSSLTIGPVGPTLHGAELTGLVLTKRSRLGDAPTLQLVRQVAHQLRSATAGDGSGAAPAVVADASFPPHEPTTGRFEHAATSTTPNTSIAVEPPTVCEDGVQSGDRPKPHSEQAAMTPPNEGWPLPPCSVVSTVIAPSDTPRYAVRPVAAGPAAGTVCVEAVSRNKHEDDIHSVTPLEQAEATATMSEDDDERSCATDKAEPNRTDDSDTPGGKARTVASGAEGVTSGMNAVPHAAAVTRRSARRRDGRLACSECTHEPEGDAVTRTMQCPICDGPLRYTAGTNREDIGLGKRAARQSRSATALSTDRDGDDGVPSHLAMSRTDTELPSPMGSLPTVRPEVAPPLFRGGYPSDGDDGSVLEVDASTTPAQESGLQDRLNPAGARCGAQQRSASVLAGQGLGSGAPNAVTAAGRPGGAALSQGLRALDLDETMGSDSGGLLRRAPRTDATGDGSTRSEDSSLVESRPPAGQAAREATSPLMGGLPQDVNGSEVGTLRRRERIAARISATKSGFLRDMSSACAPPTMAYQTLTVGMRNDGTTAVSHAEHAFRYISLFIPLSGTATDRLSRPGKVGPVSESLDVLQALFPGVQQSAIVYHRGVSTMKLKFSNLEQLRAARLEGWRLGYLPEYPPGRGPGRILPAERLDHLVVTGVLATSTQEVADTVMRRLRALDKTGVSPVCAPISPINVSDPPVGSPCTLTRTVWGAPSVSMNT